MPESQRNALFGAETFTYAVPTFTLENPIEALEKTIEATENPIEATGISGPYLFLHQIEEERFS